MIFQAIGYPFFREIKTPRGIGIEGNRAALDPLLFRVSNMSIRGNVSAKQLVT
jgi:hypothetical protein